jgi:hypothetical protein
LFALVDDASGLRAVRAVPTRAELVPELFADNRLPDLLVEWEGDGIIEQVSSVELGTVRVDHVSARTGDHTPDGLVLAMGPGIEPGMHAAIDPVEIAPRIARLLGVDYPMPSNELTASASSA